MSWEDHESKRLATAIVEKQYGGVREPSEWSCGASDIEGKTTRLGASEGGLRTSFNRTREAGNRDEVEDVVANTLKLHRDEASLLANAFASWLHRMVR